VTVDADLPDLVFLDIGMPVMNGYDVAQRLRQRPSLESMLLVAMTGLGAGGRSASFPGSGVRPPPGQTCRPGSPALVARPPPTGGRAGLRPTAGWGPGGSCGGHPARLGRPNRLGGSPHIWTVHVSG